MKRLVAVLLLALTLSACAVTGQAGKPNEAARYGDTVISVDDVSAWTVTLEDMGFRGVDPGAAVTLLLLKPTIESLAKDLGSLPADEDVKTDASLWVASNSMPAIEITDEMVEIVRLTLQFKAVLTDSDATQAFVAAAQDIAANAQVSPLYGDFTWETFSTSMQDQIDQLNGGNSNLGFVSYLVLKDVSGIRAEAYQDWMIEPSAPAAVG